MSRITTLAFAAALAGCSDPALQQKVADLEKKVEELEEKVASGGGNAGAQNDEAAIALYREANEAFRADKTDEAKKLFTKLVEEYKGTRYAQAGQRMLDQLNVVGKTIDQVEVEEWYVGQTNIDEGKATLLVFWEVWCPHCKREVPKLQATYEKYNPKGLNMMGLTKLTRGKTQDDVKAFIDEQGVAYPMGKESGAMSDFFGVQGVPAAAVVKEGKVVWRGHPAQITDAMIEDWIGA
jgi:thiol-disulfide isomerase/thioredoxin